METNRPADNSGRRYPEFATDETCMLSAFLTQDPEHSKLLLDMVRRAFFHSRHFKPSKGEEWFWNYGQQINLEMKMILKEWVVTSFPIRPENHDYTYPLLRDQALARVDFDEASALLFKYAAHRWGLLVFPE